MILAEARIPETTKEALIILVPAGQKEGSPPLFNTKVQDLAAFKGGDCMFMNLTTLKIAVQLGEKKTGVNPGEIMIHEAGALDKAVNMPIGYYVFNPQDDVWKLLSSSIVVMQPTRREICVFSWDSMYERVDYHSITFPVAPRAAEN